MIAPDQIGVPARDAASSARFLSEILVLVPATPAWPGGEMYCLPIVGSGTLLYNPTDSIAAQHIAFRVDPAAFTGGVDRLRAKGDTFGNDPDDLANGQSNDRLGGGQGRVYFLYPNGHLFEVVAGRREPPGQRRSEPTESEVMASPGTHLAACRKRPHFPGGSETYGTQLGTFCSRYWPKAGLSLLWGLAGVLVFLSHLRPVFSPTLMGSAT